MNNLWIYFTILTTLVFFISMTSLPKLFKWKRRTLIAVLFVIFAPGLFYSFTNMLSNPLPISMMAPWNVPQVEVAEVVGLWLVENEGIYLLLMYEGIDVPKYYKLPWNKDLAQQLQKAQEGSKKNGKKIMIGKPFKIPYQDSWEDEEHPFVHPFPQPMTPPDKHPGDHEIIDLDKIV